MDVHSTIRALVDWIRMKILEAKARGAVVGLSGGIDSAVVAGLCQMAFPDSTLGIIMPCHSVGQDVWDAQTVATHFGIPYMTVPLDQEYDSLLLQYKTIFADLTTAATDMVSGTLHDEMAASNLKPRLRMLTLYYFANLMNYLVVGTGNKSEITVGYFTKYGDGGVDMLPLGNLVKCQVREIARALQIPDPIIEKPPSAGLWEGQTDEGEMGLTYAEIDGYILTGHARREVEEKIRRMSARTMHKRNVPPVPPADLGFNADGE